MDQRARAEEPRGAPDQGAVGKRARLHRLAAHDPGHTIGILEGPRDPVLTVRQSGLRDVPMEEVRDGLNVSRQPTNRLLALAC